MQKLDDLVGTIYVIDFCHLFYHSHFIQDEDKNKFHEQIYEENLQIANQKNSVLECTREIHEQVGWTSARFVAYLLMYIICLL